MMKFLVKQFIHQIKSPFAYHKDQLIESLKMSVSAIIAHKLRSALTMLGGIIGVALAYALGYVINSSGWWQDYNETYLNELIELSLKNNANLAKAGVIEDDLIPKFNLSSECKSSRNLNTNAILTKSYANKISLSYELDLWHKLHDASDAMTWEVNAKCVSRI